MTILAILVPTCSNAQVPLIIDTDASFDVDDVVAICLAHALVDLGEANILAIVHNAGIPEGIGAVSVLNHYFGRDEILLGAYKGDFGKDLDGNWVRGSYVDHLVLVFLFSSQFQSHWAKSRPPIPPMFHTSVNSGH